MKELLLHHNDLKFQAFLYGSEQPANPTVLCLHGFPDNLHTFRHQTDELVSAGYQVLTAALRGYQTNSIPKDKVFSLPALASDVIAWLDELQLKQVHLVGHDWGAAIAYLTASSAPRRFSSLTTIAIPHPQRFSNEGMIGVPVQALKSWYMLFNQIPALSDYVARRNDFAFLKYLWRKWSPGYRLSEQEWKNIGDTFSQPGVIPSALSYYRQNVSPGQLLRIRKSSLSAPFIIPVPNLAITGEDDGCCDTRVFDYAVLEKDHPAGVRVERIAGAGHFVHQEKPEIVNKLLIEWFRKNDVKPNGENNE